MAQILVYSKENHDVLQNLEAQSVGVSENSVVVIHIQKNDVETIKCEGNDAIVVLKNGESIIIKHYFDFNDNSIVLEDDNDKLLWVKFTDKSGNIVDSISFQSIDEIEPLLYDDNFSGLILPWLGGGEHWLVVQHWLAVVVLARAIIRD